MLLYVIQRIVRAIFTLFVFETLLFFAIQAIPGEQMIVRPPSPAVKKQPVVAPTASAPTAKPSPRAQKKCTVKPPVEGLPLEDAESFTRDACADQILNPSEEQNLPESVPAEPKAQEQGAATAVSRPAKPSAFQQYTYWMLSLLKGNLGISTVRKRPVGSVLVELAPRTLLLFLPGALIGFFLGLRLGSIISWKRGGMGEFASTVGGVALFTAFPPFLSFILAYFFAFYLMWLPRENIINPDLWLWESVTPNQVIIWLLATMLVDSLLIYGVWRVTQESKKRQWLLRITGVVVILALTCGLWIAAGYGQLAGDILTHWIMPLTTLILLSFGGTMLLMRASMTEVLQENYINTAKAKGLPDKQVRDRHAARLALIPVVSRFVLELPLLIISGFAIERIFYWNGLGQFLFEAANKSDYPLVLGVATVVAIVILASHLFVDFLNLVLDPRLRKTLQGAEGG